MWSFFTSSSTSSKEKDATEESFETVHSDETGDVQYLTLRSGTDEYVDLPIPEKSGAYMIVVQDADNAGGASATFLISDNDKGTPAAFRASCTQSLDGDALQISWFKNDTPKIHHMSNGEVKNAKNKGKLCRYKINWTQL